MFGWPRRCSMTSAWRLTCGGVRTFKSIRIAVRVQGQGVQPRTQPESLTSCLTCLYCCSVRQLLLIVLQQSSLRDVLSCARLALGHQFRGCTHAYYHCRLSLVHVYCTITVYWLMLSCPQLATHVTPQRHQRTTPAAHLSFAADAKGASADLLPQLVLVLDLALHLAVENVLDPAMRALGGVPSDLAGTGRTS